jgi:hypothetical protein
MARTAVASFGLLSFALAVACSNQVRTATSGTSASGTSASGAGASGATSSHASSSSGAGGAPAAAMAVPGTKMSWGAFGSGGGPALDPSSLYLVVSELGPPPCPLPMFGGNLGGSIVIELLPDAQHTGTYPLHALSAEYDASIFCGGASCADASGPDMRIDISAIDTAHVAFSLTCIIQPMQWNCPANAVLGPFTAPVCQQ